MGSKKTLLPILNSVLIVLVLILIVYLIFFRSSGRTHQVHEQIPVASKALDQDGKIQAFIKKIEAGQIIKVLAHDTTPIPHLMELVTNKGNMYVDVDKNILIYGEMINFTTKQDLSQISREKVLKALSAKLHQSPTADVGMQPAIKTLASKPSQTGGEDLSKVLTPMQQEKLRYILALGGDEKQVGSNLQKMPNSLGVVYKALTKPIGMLTVFGRPGCAFCHELFRQTKNLQDHGVTVRYIFAPAPVSSHEGAVDDQDVTNTLKSGKGIAMSKVLCAKDRQKAFSDYLLNGTVPLDKPTPQCAGYVYADIKLMYHSKYMRVNHTPILIADTGKLQIGIRHGHVLQDVLALFKGKGRSKS